MLCLGGVVDSWSSNQGTRFSLEHLAVSREVCQLSLSRGFNLVEHECLRVSCCSNKIFGMPLGLDIPREVVYMRRG